MDPIPTGIQLLPENGGPANLCWASLLAETVAAEAHVLLVGIWRASPKAFVRAREIRKAWRLCLPRSLFLFLISDSLWKALKMFQTAT
jgi:hypothetical protein